MNNASIRRQVVEEQAKMKEQEEARIQELVDEGMSRSDAQAVIEAEQLS